MDNFNDNDSHISSPELNSRNRDIENHTNDFSEQETNHERIRSEQRCNDMNRQIREITSLIRTLTEMISSNDREENGNKKVGLESQAILTVLACFREDSERSPVQDNHLTEISFLSK